MRADCGELHLEPRPVLIIPVRRRFTGEQGCDGLQPGRVIQARRRRPVIRKALSFMIHGDIEHEPDVVRDLPPRGGKRRLLSQRLQDKLLDVRQQTRVSLLQFGEGGAQLPEIRSTCAGIDFPRRFERRETAGGGEIGEQQAVGLPRLL